MIPSPKLDDRRYSDILAEALQLIPRYCPEWTNHSPSDPGITLLELCAWMTELMLQRLNRVPEKNYLAFLDLIGIRLHPPQPAHTLLTFELAAGADRQTIPRGTQVATAQSDDDDPLVFETERDLVVAGVKLDRCFSSTHERYSDHSPLLVTPSPEGFAPFGGEARIDRYLYLGDSRFSRFNESTLLRLHLETPETGGRDLVRLLEWEYWNGRRWRKLAPADLEVERGEVVFTGPPDLEPTTLHAIEDTWIRGRLAEIPAGDQEAEVTSVRTVVETIGDGQAPDQALANLDNNVFIALDLGKNMHPFGSAPRLDHCFYLASRELLSEPGAEVRIEFELSDPAVLPAPTASPDLALSWEYFDGKKWRVLGRGTPDGSLPDAEPAPGFADDTRALTRSGTIRFRCPSDLRPGAVNGETNYWVRARLEAGDYGVAGSYMLEGDRWVWKDDRPLRPPGLKTIGFKLRTEPLPVGHVLSHNDFCFRDHSGGVEHVYRPFQPFAAVAEQSPALYLGWDGRLPCEPLTLHFQVSQAAGASAPTLCPAGDARSETEQKVVWESWNEARWAPLTVRDETRNFTRSGFVDLTLPEEATPSVRFGERRHWLRVRLEMGGYTEPPRILRIDQNTVAASHAITLRDEVLGSSDGTPLQTFRLVQGAFLDGEEIEVRERDQPPAGDVVDLGDRAVRAASLDEGGGVWVRWRAVESFFASGPRSRHYRPDPSSGQIEFGDGVRGMVLPPGRNNVVARQYRIGGGTHGNVNAGELTVLTRSIAYVECVSNPVPALGGSDAETVEEAKARAPMTIKSRDRAVTCEDFEALALRASTAIARAKCLPSRRHDGAVRLVIVPKANAHTTAGEDPRRLDPAPELLRLVRNHLDERRLVSTVLEVVRPSYVEISITVTLIRRAPGASERLRREIQDRLRKHLHPLEGGRDGAGWPFGRSIYKGDLARAIEDVAGVEAIDSITFFDEDRRVTAECVRLEADELVHLVHVAVVERTREEIA